MIKRVSQDLIDQCFPGWVHPYKLFETEVQKYLQPGLTLVDVGCGRSAPVLRKYTGSQMRLIGLDYTPFPQAIPGVELYNRGLSDTSLDSGSVDVIMARSVMEHVTDPKPAFKEVARILRSGGRFVFLTANKWDYASLVARLIPNKWHGRVVEMVEGRATEDVFPTAYKCNTKRDILRLAQLADLSIERFSYHGQYPNYLLFNETLFRLGAAYEHMLERHVRLKALQGWLLVTLRKP